MAEILQSQLIRITDFSDGTDTYRGISALTFRRNPRPTIPVRREGEMQPFKFLEVPSSTPLYTGSLVIRGTNALPLVGQSIASATFNAVDAFSGGNKVVTVTNLLIKDISSSISEATLNDATHTFEAADFTITDAP